MALATVSFPGERREMAQESSLQKPEEAASKAKLLEVEKIETVARIQVLEGELKVLVSLADRKTNRNGVPLVPSDQPSQGIDWWQPQKPTGKYDCVHDSLTPTGA
jgi:hypothetical protein